MLYYKLANNFKDKRKYHLSKDCFLKCFNIFKENEQYYHYSMTEILRDYCKLLVILGEIYAAEMNYKYLIQHSFILDINFCCIAAISCFLLELSSFASLLYLESKQGIFCNIPF